MHISELSCVFSFCPHIAAFVLRARCHWLWWFQTTILFKAEILGCIFNHKVIRNELSVNPLTHWDAFCTLRLMRKVHFHSPNSIQYIDEKCIEASRDDLKSTIYLTLSVHLWSYERRGTHLHNGNQSKDVSFPSESHTGFTMLTTKSWGPNSALVQGTGACQGPWNGTPMLCNAVIKQNRLWYVSPAHAESSTHKQLVEKAFWSGSSRLTGRPCNNLTEISTQRRWTLMQTSSGWEFEFLIRFHQRYRNISSSLCQWLPYAGW